MCAGCVADCCSRFNVLLTHVDVGRIHRHLKLDPIDFTSPFPESAAFVGNQFAAFEMDGEMHFLALDKKLGKGTCAFSLALGNSKRCGIHAFKPMVCRTYPFTLDSEGRLETVEPSLCRKYWWPEKKERVQTINSILLLRNELEEYRLLVHDWNCRQRTGQGGFPEFLAFVLAWKPRSGSKR